jgi:hypothetical protein
MHENTQSSVVPLQIYRQTAISTAHLAGEAADFFLHSGFRKTTPTWSPFTRTILHRR